MLYYHKFFKSQQIIKNFLYFLLTDLKKSLKYLFKSKKEDNMDLLKPEEIFKKYEEEIEKRKKRLDNIYSFKEADRVPILISTSGPYYAWLFGYDIKDYYENFEVQIEVQLKGLNWKYEYLGDDSIGGGIWMDIGIIAEGIYFDCPIERPKGTTPWVVPILQDEKDIINFKVPEPEKAPGLKLLEEMYTKFKRAAKKFGIEIESKGPRCQIHPPLSAACAIMEPTKVYQIMLEDKELTKIFLEKMFNAFCKLVDYYDKKYNTKTESIGLANDNACFISNKMYVEQVLPYDKAIYEKYGKKWRYMHTDGPSDHNFKTFAEELKLNAMDIGGWSSIGAAVKYLKGRVVFSGGLNCKDFYKGFTDEVKNKVDYTLKLAAPGGGFILGIGGETYVGVPPDSLRELVDYVKINGKYPI